MPPTLRPRAVGPPSVSPLSGSDGPTSPPGDASPDDNPLSALRRDLEVQHALHREDTTDLRATTVPMSQLLRHMAGSTPAVPVYPQYELIAHLLGVLNN